ncbi:MAG: DUF2794 domain-containing protein [Rhodospirillales bacterium]|nr:DUF2794 domain-containing protein [Rhodospirillales bacterium]
MTPETARLVRLGDYRRHSKTTYFERAELLQLLRLYSRKVASGEWRDYAIDHREGVALFSVFRHSHESPLYTIVKHGPEFAVFRGRQRIGAAKSLSDLLDIFRTKPSLVRA